MASETFSRELIREWVDQLNPKPISPSDPRYVSLENLVLDGRTVNLRGEDWIEDLYRQISYSKAHTCQLFSGYSGTGKSTELNRLKEMLEADGYLVLLADAKQYHDLEHPLAIEDMTIILAGAFSDLCETLLDRNVLGDTYWERFLRFLQTELDVQELRAKISILDLKAVVRAGEAPFWATVKQKLAASPGRLKEHAHEFVAKCVRLLQKKKPGRQVVFILDSLEKLRGPQARFLENMESIRNVFARNHDILRLPDCHVVYTVPPYASLQGTSISQSFDGQTNMPLPAIKVAEKLSAELRPAHDGISGLIQLVGKRIPLEKVFAERIDLLERIVLYSGGHVRFLLRIVQNLIVDNADQPFPPEDSLVDKQIRNLTEYWTRAVRPEDVSVLHRIHRDQDITQVSVDELAHLARFMDSNLVLCYQNGEGWFEIHPLIRDDIVKRANKG